MNRDRLATYLSRVSAKHLDDNHLKQVARIDCLSCIRQHAKKAEAPLSREDIIRLDTLSARISDAEFAGVDPLADQATDAFLAQYMARLAEPVPPKKARGKR